MTDGKGLSGAAIGGLEGQAKLLDELADGTLVVGNREVEFGSHGIEEDAEAQQFEHNHAGASSVAGEPGSLVNDRGGREGDLGNGAVTEHLAGLSLGLD